MRKVLYILGQLDDADVEWLATNGQRQKLAKGIRRDPERGEIGKPLHRHRWPAGGGPAQWIPPRRGWRRRNSWRNLVGDFQPADRIGGGGRGLRGARGIATQAAQAVAARCRLCRTLLSRPGGVPRQSHALHAVHPRLRQCAGGADPARQSRTRTTSRTPTCSMTKCWTRCTTPACDSSACSKSSRSSDPAVTALRQNALGDNFRRRCPLLPVPVAGAQELAAGRGTDRSAAAVRSGARSQPALKGRGDAR
jgi:hypothetical protein